MKSLRELVILAAVVGLVAGCQSREITADTFRVERVIDGDTFVIRYDGEPTSVRLYGFDAPEPNEPGGRSAAADLRDMIEGRTVRLVFPARRKRDNFGRLLARVYVDGIEVRPRCYGS